MPVPIHEHPHGDRIEVDGLHLEGWLAKASCVRCRGPLVYYVVFDAIFCAGCNEWAVFLCNDPDCMYCRVRPEKPIAA